VMDSIPFTNKHVGNTHRHADSREMRPGDRETTPHTGGGTKASFITN
jgi:hypothetical protein